MLIDLHLHTTASDGRLTPTALVARVVQAGITTMSVTDHDTVAGLAEARSAASAAGVDLVNGIEITATHDGRDVHMLGYFIDPDDAQLAGLLERQRGIRVERLREIADRLAQLAMPIDINAVIGRVAPHAGASVGRPLIARALIEAGYVSSFQEAFDQYLGAGRPAFVPRRGPTPAEVVHVIHHAAGLASLAHPGVTRQPTIIEPLVDDGLDALEAYHSDHTPEVRAEVLALAAQLQVHVTGGSDFHGDDDRRRPLGESTLPRDKFVTLSEAAVRRASKRALPPDA